MDDFDVSFLRNRCVARLQQLRKMRWVLAMNLIFSVRDLLNKSRGWLLLLSVGLEPKSNAPYAERDYPISSHLRLPPR